MDGFFVGQTYSAPLVATGGTWPYAWSITGGSLPEGLTLDPATGVVSGEPTAAGISTFTVRVTDSSDPGQTDTATLSTLVRIVTISTTSLPNGSVGQPFSASLEATGGVAPYAWSITNGAPPEGLTLDSATGVVSGTPVATGISTFTVEATDSSSPVNSASASLSIAIGVTITTASLPNGAERKAYSVLLMAVGGNPPYTWSVTSGGLPKGLRLDKSTGVISGTPKRKGTFTFTARVVDRKTGAAPRTRNTATKVFSIKIS